ncbi:MAG: ribonuclease E/G [Gluconacetobacter diazotrophicus]|nr:ribonuclease E/G [Gluconacetobacter diazotrophicus]
MADSQPGQVRIAVADGAVLLDYALWRPGAPDGVGELHRGRIEAVLPALGGAFIAIGGGATGFLPLSGSASPAPEGTPLGVEIVRAAQGGKGPRLAARPLPADVDVSGPPALVRPGPSPLDHLAARHDAAPIRVNDPSLRAEAAPALRPRMTVTTDGFPSGIEDQVAALASPDIALPGGMRASIHPTPALVAIDLDAGAASADRAPRQAAQFAANRMALPPLLHQLRLRDLSGAILLDLAGLPSRKRPALRDDIAAVLARDPAAPRLLGFTALGLAEILRPRQRPPLHELLAGPHAAALAALRDVAAAAAFPGAPLPDIHASLPVAAAIDGDAAARRWFERRYGRAPLVRADPALSGHAWTLIPGHRA